MQTAIFVLIGVLMVMLLIKGLIVIWHKMHAFVGIEVGYPQEAMLLPYQQKVQLSTNISINDAQMAKINPRKSRHRYWKTPYGNIHPLHCLTGVDVDKLCLMPQQAVQTLVAINERVAQYLSWQQQSHTQADGTTLTNWLTEKQFVIERLISHTIPEAVSQYDQLARFSPQRLNQPIHDNMTAGELLVGVLQTVERQINELLDDVFHQTSLQLTTTYRYVKTRTQCDNF